MNAFNASKAVNAVNAFNASKAVNAVNAFNASKAVNLWACWCHRLGAEVVSLAKGRDYNHRSISPHLCIIKYKIIHIRKYTGLSPIFQFFKGRARGGGSPG